MIGKIKGFLLDLFFPKFCFGCKKEGNYLCDDCQAVLGVLEHSFCLCQKPIRLPSAGKCQKCGRNSLNGLYFALPYENRLTRELIHKFKYEPFTKELAETLASLIIIHFQMIEKKKSGFSDFILVPVPLSKKRMRWRGFNQAEEIGKNLSKRLEIPLINDVLLKTKETLCQIELDNEQRQKNTKDVFTVKNREKITGRKVLLLDDVYTTGSTMEEACKALKKSGAKEVWGVAVARG